MDNKTNLTQPINTTGSPKCEGQKPMSDYEKWATVAFYIVIILFDLIGNSLVIVIVQRNHRMKNATNYLIVNLSVTEILSTMINLNMSMAANAIYPKYFPYVNDIFAMLVCKTLPFMDSLSHSLSTLSLTVISFDRFFAVKYPLKRVITRGRAKKIIAVIWLMSVIASSPLLYAYSYENKNRLDCPFSWAPLPENSHLIYTCTHLVLFYVIPLAVMGVLYSVTVRKLWSRRIPGNVTEANQRVEQHAKLNVFKMCLTVVVVFAICWLPLYLTRVINVAKVLECGVPPTANNVIVFLAHTYYAINPCIYFAFSKDYRRGFLQIVQPIVELCRSKHNRGHLGGSRVMELGMSPRTDLSEHGIQAISFRSLRSKDVMC